MLLKKFEISYKQLDNNNTLDEEDKTQKKIFGLKRKTYEEIRKFNKLVSNYKLYKPYQINIEEDNIYIDMKHPKTKNTFSIPLECFNFKELPIKARSQIIELSFKK